MRQLRLSVRNSHVACCDVSDERIVLKVEYAYGIA